MSRYTVTAERGARTWVLQCQEFPAALSEVTRLDQADVIREAIAFVAGVPEQSVEYELVPMLDPALLEHLTAARTIRARTTRPTTDATDELTRAARALRSAGLSVRDIGYLLDVSRQRVQQLSARPLAAESNGPSAVSV